MSCGKPQGGAPPNSVLTAAVPPRERPIPASSLDTSTRVGSRWGGAAGNGGPHRFGVTRQGVSVHPPSRENSLGSFSDSSPRQAANGHGESAPGNRRLDLFSSRAGLKGMWRLGYYHAVVTSVRTFAQVAVELAHYDQVGRTSLPLPPSVRLSWWPPVAYLPGAISLTALPIRGPGLGN
jgi:hypothetical protein